MALVLHVVEAVLHNRMPSGVVEAETIGAAIGFVKWSINQTRILYAELGLTQHDQSSHITRFVERFQGQEIDAYRVRAWNSSCGKPTIPQCRDFMEKLVSLGYAQSNGIEGRGYKITLLNVENRSIGQLLSQSDFPGQKTGQFWSMPVNKSSTPKDVDGKIDHSLTEIDRKIDRETGSQTTVDRLTDFSIDIGISIGDRVRYVGHEFWRICGDRVLTVKAIEGDIAIVSYPSWVIDNKFPLQDLQKVSEV